MESLRQQLDQIIINQQLQFFGFCDPDHPSIFPFFHRITDQNRDSAIVDNNIYSQAFDEKWLGLPLALMLYQQPVGGTVKDLVAIAEMAFYFVRPDIVYIEMSNSGTDGWDKILLLSAMLDWHDHGVNIVALKPEENFYQHYYDLGFRCVDKRQALTVKVNWICHSGCENG